MCVLTGGTFEAEANVDDTTIKAGKVGLLDGSYVWVVNRLTDGFTARRDNRRRQSRFSIAE